MDAVKALHSLRAHFESAAGQHPALRLLVVGGLRNKPGELEHANVVKGRKNSRLGPYGGVGYGNPLPIAAPCFYRGDATYYFYGELPKAGGYSRFRELATDAGRCLLKLRPRKEPLAALVAAWGTDPFRLWIRWLLAGAHGAHPVLRTQTCTRLGPIVVPMHQFWDARERSPQGNIDDIFSFAARQLPAKPPWYTMLEPAVFRASALAVDVVELPVIFTPQPKATAPDTPRFKKSERALALLLRPPPQGWTRKALAKAAGYTQSSSLHRIKGFNQAWEESARRTRLDSVLARSRPGSGPPHV